MHKLIFGKDKRTNIVNITCVDGMAYIYQADGETTTCTVEEYVPYALTKEEYGDSLRLRGPGYYKYKTPITETPYDELYGKGIYKPRTKEEGYMLTTGTTYFKGMKVDEVSLLSFDIEATSLDPYDPKAKVVLISNTYRNRSGYITRKLFDINSYEHLGSNACYYMIKDWCTFVCEVNPDIMIAHNVFGYDINYLNVLSNSELRLGRDGSTVWFDSRVSKKRKDGGQQYEYFNAHIHGREIVDSMFMSITYDSQRNFPSYGLKNIEKHLGLVDGSRIDWDFNKNPVADTLAAGGQLWNDFCTYCETDSDSPVKMFDIMAPSLFYLNQSIPKTFQQMVNEASGSQIDSFMIRSYLQDGWAQPMTSQKSDFQGAISMGIPGVYDNVMKVDVASLYPSIMLQYEVYPKQKDPERHFLKSLQYFRDERLKNKELGKTDPYHQGLSDAQKIIINSMYGFMGAGYLLYNDPPEADKVTFHGREILQQGVEWATGCRLDHVVKHIKNKGKPNEEKEYHWVMGERRSEGRGYTIVNTDTDSFSFTNGLAPSPDTFVSEINNLNSIYPEMIKWEDDGIFDRVVVVAAKNYILQKGDKIKYKGSGIKDSKKEPIMREFMDEMFGVLLTKDDIMDYVKLLYNKYIELACNINDISKWTVKKTVTKSLLNATTPAQVNVLKALQNEPVQEGDKIWLFVDKDPDSADPSDPKFKKYTLSSKFEGSYHKYHYVKRVYDTLCILKNLIDIKKFDKYYLKTKRGLLGN